MITKPSRAYLQPDKSYVKPTAKEAALLKHEQGHFDIAEIFARQLTSKSSMVMCCKADGTMKTFAEISKELSAIEKEVLKAWDDYNKAYDMETDHSVKQKEQNDWNDKISKALEPPKK